MVSLSTLLAGSLTTDFDFTNTPEAKQAQQLLKQQQLQDDSISETFVVTGSGPGAIQDPAFVERVNGLLSGLQALGPDVVAAVPASFPPPEEAASDPQLAALGPIPSEDGKAVLFFMVYKGDIDQATEHFAEIDALREEASGDGVTAYMLGQVSSSEDFKKISEEDLRFGETIGVAAAILVLIIVFGAIVAGVAPIVMGMFAIAVTLGIVGLLGQVWHFSFFTPNLISMMGLAVGIDYSLFIVSRYREERHRGRDKLDAIAASGATANRAVFFSGLTVVLALAGMLLVPTTIFRSLAGGAIIVVLVSVAASMTLLPAIIALLGDWMNWPWLSRIANLIAFFVIAIGVSVVAGLLTAAGAPPILVLVGYLVAIAAIGILMTKAVRNGFGFLKRYARPEGEGSEHGKPGGFWDRASRTVMAHPVVWLVARGRAS